MAFLSSIGSILGGIGSIESANAQSKALNQAAQAAQGAYNNQAQIDNQIEQFAQQLGMDAGTLTRVLPQLGQLFSGELSGAGSLAPGAAKSFLGNAMDPNALAHLTGINAGGLTNDATQFLSNPGATQVGQLGPALLQQLGQPTALQGVTPGALSFFGNEMQTGLDPRVATAAQSQLQQGATRSFNDIRSQLAPGQNPGAIQRDITNNLLQQQTNLAGNLAGQSQQFENQGAQGVTGTAGALDAQTFSRIAQMLQTGQVTDQQAIQMLTQGAQLGTNYNQTVLGNQNEGAQFGQNLLSQILGYGMGGEGLRSQAGGLLDPIGSQYGQQGQFATGLAAGAPSTNPFSALGGFLASNPNLFGSRGTGSQTQTPGIGPLPATQAQLQPLPTPQMNYTPGANLYSSLATQRPPSLMGPMP